jgi:hypothetical protein
MNQDYLTSEDGLDRFSAGFENGTLPGAEFTHAAHDALCCIHLYRDDAETALDHLRGAIPRFNLSAGGQNTDTSGYHETLTVFWVRVLAAFHAREKWNSRLRFVLEGIAEFGGRSKLHTEYYSYDVVQSKEARRIWVPPDRRAIG